MKKNVVATLIALSLAASPLHSQTTSAPAQEPGDGCFGLSPQIQNIGGRNAVPLQGEWKAFIDPYETGYYDYRRNPMPDGATFFADRSFAADRTKLVEYDFDLASTLKVPGDWNTQRPELYLYEGTVWYRQKFHAQPRPGCRTFLYFGAANYEAVVGFNGHPVARHMGGYTPFNVEVTDRLSDGENTVIVKVDNKRMLEGVPTVNSDWWNYGGITRGVYLVTVPETFIRDYCIRLSSDRRRIEGWAQLDGTDFSRSVTLDIAELGIHVSAAADASGKASFSVKASPVLWSPSNPKLYDVTLTSGADSVRDRIGFRTIETRGTQILLNGEPVFCKGISIHEEEPFAPSGRACGAEDARTLLGWARELGCNFVRLAHYPHNEDMVRTAEEMGIMVWDEIPVYWTIQWDSPGTYLNALHQLEDMIVRDRNRAGVVIWSVANETPRGEARLEFLRKLISRAREMDGTRLVSAAMEKENIDEATLTVNDELLQYTDIISFNQYVGWYDGDSDKCDRVSWTFPLEKPVFITELGGGAKFGLHGARTERFTEEYQDYLYVKNLQMLERIDALAGVTPWVLKDFRSPRRFLPGVQDDFNRKGLLSEQGERKQAFFTYKAWRPAVPGRPERQQHLSQANRRSLR